MAKTFTFLIGASALALMSMTAPPPASAGSHVSIEVGPGGVYIDRVIATTMTRMACIGVVTTAAHTTGTTITTIVYMTGDDSESSCTECRPQLFGAGVSF